ncbi:MAG: putative MFS family arabinose efflux permease [Candidatus Poriferisodalaceae bacterium]|jgi:predicted MFS family arabinose efflux permease
MTRLGEPEHLLVLCGATLLVMAGQGVVCPLIPRYAAEFGVGAAAAGFMLSVFALARLMLNFPAGMIGSGFAANIWTLLLWRFVAGADSALYMSGALIYLIDIARPDGSERNSGRRRPPRFHPLQTIRSASPSDGNHLHDQSGHPRNNRFSVIRRSATELG